VFDFEAKLKELKAKVKVSSGVVFDFKTEPRELKAKVKAKVRVFDFEAKPGSSRPRSRPRLFDFKANPRELEPRPEPFPDQMGGMVRIRVFNVKVTARFRFWVRV